jgi:hypothetical protein
MVTGCGLLPRNEALQAHLLLQREMGFCLAMPESGRHMPSGACRKMHKHVHCGGKPVEVFAEIE